MASRRRTRGGGGSTESSTGACSPTNMVNESMDVNPNDLLAMLAGEEEETDEEGEEEEGRDIVTALEGQFAGALDQRKTEKRKREGEGAAAAAPDRLIKTVTRIRKLGPDAGPLSLRVDEGSSTTVTTTNPDPKTSRAARESFVSDRVLDESVGQEGVFREIEPAVTGLFQGFSSIVLTYGSTGSGKSYTITGADDDAGVGPGDDGREGVLTSGDGFLPRALERMYQQVGRDTSGEDGLDGGGGSSSETSVQVVSVRALEVYNNKLYDLLRDGDQTGRHLSIRQGDDGQDVIEGLGAAFPADLPSALACAKAARSRSHVNRTRLNDKSSRGHVIFVLGAHGGACKTAADLEPSDPVMYVCDLAGPERQDRAALAATDAGGSGSGSGDLDLRKVEANNINTDTSALFRLWKDVRGGTKSVSCRARTLTRLLKSLFVRPRDAPRINCVMMVCVNPAASEYGETNKVLKNSQISSTVLAAVVEEGPSIRKRQRLGNRPGAGGGAAAVTAAAAAAGSSIVQVASAAAEGKGKWKGRLKRPGVAAQGPGPEGEGEGEPGLVVKLREEIERLKAEKARMQEEHEVKLYEMEATTRQESEGELLELEADLEEKCLKIRLLKEQLQNKSPVGAGARAAVAQSAMKLREKQAESVRKLERQTTREADEEVARTASERARAEEKLATTQAERDRLKAFAERETSRADAAEAKTARVVRERSEERSARRELEGTVERLEAAAKADAGRAEELEGKLLAAQEEIARLESDRQEALSAASAAAAVPVPGDSSAHSSPTMAGGSQDGSTEGSLFELGGSGQEEDRQGVSSASMLDDFGSRSSSSSSSSRDVGGNGSPAGGHHHETDDAICENEGKSEEVDDEAEPCTVEKPERSPSRSPSPSPRVVANKTRGRRRVGQSEPLQIAASPADGTARQRKPKQGVDRKPLGNLQNGATPARAKKERAKKAGERTETQRCKEMRRNARVSKPSPEVVVMTEKQAKNADIGRRILRERRRGRQIV